MSEASEVVVAWSAQQVKELGQCYRPSEEIAVLRQDWQPARLASIPDAEFVEEVQRILATHEEIRGSSAAGEFIDRQVRIRSFRLALSATAPDAPGAAPLWKAKFPARKSGNE